MEEDPSQQTLVEASPLISFLKVDRFDLLETVSAHLLCTTHVTEEIRLFKQQERLRRLFAEGRIKEVILSEPLHLTEFAALIDQTPLGPGEASSLLYAAYHDCSLVITDKKGIREAKHRGVVCITTQEVMVLSIQQGRLTVAEADALIIEWKAVNEFPVSCTSFQQLVDDIT